jgi:hypothetical protein
VDVLTRDFQDLLSLFDQHGVRFLIVGGFALAAHGHPRYTKDLDVWVDASIENGARIVTALGEFGFDSLGLTADDFSQTGQVVQLGREPGRVDLLTSVSGLSFAEAFAAREVVSFGSLSIPIIDRRSLIINKRASGRPQDLADVARLEKGRSG